jgi:hypothetical protein
MPLTGAKYLPDEFVNAEWVSNTLTHIFAISVLAVIDVDGNV